MRKSRNLAAMSAAAQQFLGQHDFRNLCKIDTPNVSNFERSVARAAIATLDGQTGAATAIAAATNADVDADAGSSDTAHAAVAVTADVDSDESNNSNQSSDDRYQICRVELAGQSFLWHQVSFFCIYLHRVPRLTSVRIIPAMSLPFRRSNF